MAKDCLLIPPTPAQLVTAGKMADNAIAAGPKHGAWLYFEFVKGLAEYRLGHFTNAVEWLQKVPSPGGDLYRNVQAGLVLAMAQYRLNQNDEARGALTNAVEFANSKLPKLNKGLDEQWDDWLRAKILLREAEGLASPKDAH